MKQPLSPITDLRLNTLRTVYYIAAVAFVACGTVFARQAAEVWADHRRAAWVFAAMAAYTFITAVKYQRLGMKLLVDGANSFRHTFYWAFFRENPHADQILNALGLDRNRCGRYRDAFVAAGEIAIYTRNGGRNREHWEERGSILPGLHCPCPGCVMAVQLPLHPNYLRNEDDPFDNSYATVYFSIPEGHKDLQALDVGLWDPSARWRDKMYERLRVAQERQRRAAAGGVPERSPTRNDTSVH